MSRIYQVVVADDVAALRRLIRLNLESSGRFRVVGEAGTGREAVRLAGERHPELMLLDLSMPEMDGLEALPEVLRASTETRVVVLSGFNHVRMAPVAMRLGATAYLEKGLEPNMLVEKLLAILENGPPAPAATAAPPPPEAPSARFLFLTASDTLPARARAAMPAANVEQARDLPAAVARLKAGGIDLLLVDGAGDDPEPLLVELLANVGRAAVAVLVNAPDGKQAATCFRLGVEECIPRDVAPDVLARWLLYALERRRAHEARQAAREQHLEVRRLQELDHLKAEFFNAAAHELNTPLTPIKLQIHLLRSASGLGPEHQRAVAILDRSVERLSTLAHDLLDVARVQAGKLRAAERVELGALVREVTEAFAPVAAAKGVRLDSSIKAPIWVRGDALRLVQVLYNLVSNAVKFTPNGGHVDLDASAIGAEAVVEVHDTGAGFTGEQGGRLFEPFVRVHESSDPGVPGTGLGLFVCKGIVHLHGGKIWCNSEGPGRGSTFGFRLPLAGPEVVTR